MAGPEGGRPHFDREPQPSRPTEQHKPHLEAGNGVPGLPLTTQERAKPPPPEGSAHGRSESTYVQEPLEQRGSGFDCVLPEITIPPVHLRSMLRSGSITKEQAQQFEQEWRENLKTWDRQSLEEEVRDLKEERDDASRNNKQEQARDVEYQLEALQEELQQRKFH